MDDLFGFGEGSVADAKRGVVGHRDGRAILAEDLLEVARSLAEFDIDDHVGAVFEFGDRLSQVLAGGHKCRRVDGQLLAVVLFSCTTDTQNIDRLDDLAAAESGGSPSGDELGFVGVVVQYFPHAVQIQL